MPDRCVICGEIIPEGRQVCINCEISKSKDELLALKSMRQREELMKDIGIKHEKEQKLLKFIRKLKYGELVVKVQDGLPVLVERVTEKVKL